jgi:hypothetical protein
VRPISQPDEELFRTVFVAAKMGRADALVARLAGRYAEEWDNPEAGFPYALALMAALTADASRAQAVDANGQSGFLQLIETLDDVLYNLPDHWLGRYCRVAIRVLLPATSEVYPEYLSEERTKLHADLTELLDRQSQARWQPYFASTCLVAARLAHASGQDAARVEEFVDRAASGPARPIPFPTLGAFLAQPFLVAYGIADFPARPRIGALMSTLFPDLPAARALVGAGPVG